MSSGVRAMNRSPIAPEMLAGEYLFRRYGATVAEYERAANEDARIELIDGVMLMHSPANVKHERVFWFLGALLKAYVETRRVGEVFGSRTAVILDDERRVEPDLLFVGSASLDRLGDVSLEGPPDVAIEILSPATRDYDLGEKRRVYADAGIAEYWIIDPMSNRFLFDRPAGTRVAEMTEGRFESSVITGFWLDVAWLWREPLPDAAECLKSILSRA
jgi:Uma2 family endonuclease